MLAYHSLYFQVAVISRSGGYYYLYGLMRVDAV